MSDWCSTLTGVSVMWEGKGGLRKALKGHGMSPEVFIGVV